MRRTVATLLVVTSPLLLASPVGAGDERPTQGNGAPAVASAIPGRAGALPAVPAAAQTGPAAPALTTVTAAPAAVAPPVALPAPAATPPLITPAPPAPVRQTVKPARAMGRAAVAGLSDSAYSAKLQAELCAARQIFCGLDRHGRYPAR